MGPHKGGIRSHDLNVSAQHLTLKKYLDHANISAIRPTLSTYPYELSKRTCSLHLVPSLCSFNTSIQNNFYTYNSVGSRLETIITSAHVVELRVNNVKLLITICQVLNFIHHHLSQWPQKQVGQLFSFHFTIDECFFWNSVAFYLELMLFNTLFLNVLYFLGIR